MTTEQQTITVDAFFEIAALPENENARLELEGGVIIHMAPSRPENTVTAMRIGYFLNAFVLPKDLGYVTGSDGGFVLAEGRIRQPDVGYISKARAPELPERFELAPDLAVEVVSADEDVFKKTRDHLSAGAKLVWAIYPDEKTVYVFRSRNGEVIGTPFTIGDTLHGEDVLPGFSLPVADIFPG